MSCSKKLMSGLLLKWNLCPELKWNLSNFYIHELSVSCVLLRAVTIPLRKTNDLLKYPPWCLVTRCHPYKELIQRFSISELCNYMGRYPIYVSTILTKNRYVSTISTKRRYVSILSTNLVGFDFIDQLSVSFDSLDQSLIQWFKDKKIFSFVRPVQICFGFLEQKSICFDFLEWADRHLKKLFVWPSSDKIRLSGLARPTYLKRLFVRPSSDLFRLSRMVWSVF